jgi:hypothetical protein
MTVIVRKLVTSRLDVDVEDDWAVIDQSEDRFLIDVNKISQALVTLHGPRSHRSRGLDTCRQVLYPFPFP